MLAARAEGVLLSYYYIRERNIVNPEVFHADYPVKILVDSGAHTLQEGEDRGEYYYEKYVADYCEWLVKYKSKIFAAVELDIEETIGLEKVLKIQEKYFIPLQKELPIIFVWHYQRGPRYWVEMCKTFHYVGLPDESLTLGQQISMLNTARQHGAKVHGFAMTKPDILLKVPYYSIDSTRWLTGEEYGCTFVWKINKMVEILKNNKDMKKPLRPYFLRLGLDFDKIMSEDPLEIGKTNIKAWMQCIDYVNKRTVLKQYWLQGTVPASIEKLAKEGNEKSPEIQAEVAQGVTEGSAKGVYKELSKIESLPEPFTDQERALAGEVERKKWELRHNAILCDNCYASTNCKHVQAGAICKLNKEFLSMSPSRNPKEVLGRIQGFLGSLEERANRALYYEAVDGGMPDKTATGLLKDLIDYNIKLLEIIKEKKRAGERVTFEGSDVLERIFGKPGKIVSVTDIIEEKT